MLKIWDCQVALPLTTAADVCECVCVCVPGRKMRISEWGVRGI